MKKAAKKVSKTESTTKPTPAPKAPAKKAAKKAAVKAVRKTVTAKAPAKAASPAKPKTTIVANVDVGFGNILYIRGDAPGLSWTKGVPLDCKDANSWSIVMEGVTEAFEYKLLINDIHWSQGANDTAKPGESNVSSPAF